MVGTFIAPIFQVRELRLKKCKETCLRPHYSQRAISDLNPDLPPSQSVSEAFNHLPPVKSPTYPIIRFLHALPKRMVNYNVNLKRKKKKLERKKVNEVWLSQIKKLKKKFLSSPLVRGLDKGRADLVSYGSPGIKSRIPQWSLWGLVLQCLSMQHYQGCKKRP